MKIGLKEKIYGYHFLSEFLIGVFFTCAIINVNRMGLSLRESSFAWATYMAAIAFFELPTGVIADRFGRKMSSDLGVVLITLSTLSLMVFSSVPVVLLALLVSGIGYTLLSGAKVTWFYRLKEMGYFEMESKSLFLTLDLIRRIGLIVSAFVEVKISDWNPHAAWAIASVFGVLALIFSRFIQADDTKTLWQAEPSSQKSIGLKETLLGLPHRKPLIIFYCAGLFFALAFGIMDVLLQPHLDQTFSVNALVITTASMHVIGLIMNRVYVRWLSNSSHEMVACAWVMFLLFLSYFAAAEMQNWSLFLPLWCIGYAGMGWFYPTRDHFITRVTPSRLHASFLSIDSMLESFFRAIVALVIGFSLSTNHSYQPYWRVGMFLLAVGAILYFYGRQFETPKKALL
jgi:MFS family permease